MECSSAHYSARRQARRRAEHSSSRQKMGGGREPIFRSWQRDEPAAYPAAPVCGVTGPAPLMPLSLPGGRAADRSRKARRAHGIQAALDQSGPDRGRRMSGADRAVWAGFHTVSSPVSGLSQGQKRAILPCRTAALPCKIFILWRGGTLSCPRVSFSCAGEPFSDAGSGRAAPDTGRLARENRSLAQDFHFPVQENHSPMLESGQVLQKVILWPKIFILLHRRAALLRRRDGVQTGSETP